MTILCHGRAWIFAPPILVLAVNCAAAAQTSLDAQAVSDNSIDPAEASLRLDGLASRLRDHSSLQRVQIIEALSASSSIMADSVNGVLLDTLDDRDPLVGEAALRALLARDDEQLSQVRESQLAKHPGEASDLVRVRLAARSEDISALRKLMRNGDALVQESAFDALAANDADAAVELLKKEFQNHASLYRLQTLNLFIRSPYTNSSATLLPILELASKDADPLIRDRAVQLLAEKTAESLQHDSDT